MSKSYYAQLLKSLEWKQRRDEILERDEYTCAVPGCGATENLQVHHRYYVPNRLPWNYPDWSLRTLCARCHGKEHQNQTFADWEWTVQELLREDIEAVEDLGDALNGASDFEAAVRRATAAIQNHV